MAHRLGLVSLFPLFLIALVACSSKESKPEGEPTELRSSDAEIVEGGETRLLEAGKELFESGLYTVARDSFESLRSNFPLSPYLEFSEIKIADSYFLTNEFVEAASEYENFFKNHPGSENAVYALLMAGRSQHLANRGIGRDVVPLEKARELYERVIQQYPDSPYIDKAKKFRRELLEDLAAYDRLVIDFYKRKDAKIAVKERRKEYKKKWAELLRPERETALESGGDGAEKPVNAGKPAKPSLLAAFDGKASRDRTKTLPQHSAAPVAIENTTEAIIPDLVRSIECKGFNSGISQVVLYLNSDLGSDFLSSTRTISAKEGKLTLELPQSQNREFVQNCFASKDLRLSRSGVLTLNTAKNATVTRLASPERLLLLIE